jgi:hypothetical protein
LRQDGLGDIQGITGTKTGQECTETGQEGTETGQEGTETGREVTETGQEGTEARRARGAYPWYPRVFNSISARDHVSASSIPPPGVWEANKYLAY